MSIPLVIVFYFLFVMNFTMSQDTMDISVRHSPFPSFHKPVIVGFYSVDVNRQMHMGAGNLKYLHHDSSSIKHDLNVGFENYVGKKRTFENDERIDTLLEWMTRQKFLNNIVNDESQKNRTTFVCARGLLSTVMRTPYEYSEGWRICATNVKNIIFLCAFYTDEKKQKMQQNVTEKDHRFEYWGFKFEQCVLSDSPLEPPNTNKVLDSNEEFNLVYRSRLNENNLVYGAEVDGVDTYEHIKNVNCSILNQMKFIELKTNRMITFDKQDLNFKRHKLIRWWCQSFVVGIENITCGFRDDNGIIVEVEKYNVKDLPKIAEGKWNATACMLFLDDFLNYVKVSLADEPDNTTYCFEWFPRSSYVTRRKITNNSEYVILPQWFSL